MRSPIYVGSFATKNASLVGFEVNRCVRWFCCWSLFIFNGFLDQFTFIKRYPQPDNHIVDCSESEISTISADSARWANSRVYSYIISMRWKMKKNEERTMMKNETRVLSSLTSTFQYKPPPLENFSRSTQRFLRHLQSFQWWWGLDETRAGAATALYWACLLLLERGAWKGKEQWRFLGRVSGSGWCLQIICSLKLFGGDKKRRRGWWRVSPNDNWLSVCQDIRTRWIHQGQCTGKKSQIKQTTHIHININFIGGFKILSARYPPRTNFFLITSR